MAKCKAQWTAEQSVEIKRIQKATGVTRKTAIRRMLAAEKEASKAAKKLLRNAKHQPAAVDVKMAAANDNPETVAEPSAPERTPTTAPAEANPGAARAEGIRLFKLAGRPTKEQFIAVYGEMGARWTWEQRAKAVGLATAEEAAASFQAALAKAANV